MKRLTSLTLSAVLTAAGCTHGAAASKPAPQQTQDMAPALAQTPAAGPLLPPPRIADVLSGSVEAYTTACEADLERAREQIAALKKLDTRRASQAVLAAYDEAMGALTAAANRSSLAREVHPEAAFRDAARECEQRVDSANVALEQDRGVYDALVAVDLSGADAATKYWMERALLDFRRAGVDRDDATRAKVKSLNEDILKLGQAFGKNIAEDVRSVSFSPKELDGLPEDYRKAHPPGKDGKVVITTNTPDYFPFMTYAKDTKAREKLWRTYRQRAFPANQQVLSQLIAKRHELATLLGYESWAAYTTETKMTRTRQVAADFIDKLAAATEARAKKEHAELLARKQQDVPGAKTLEPWDQDFYEDRVRAERFGFDSQAVRPYFEYGRVKAGVMDITARMWGITYRKVDDAKVWHPEVEVYDMFDGSRLLGRIYLDMHPRDDKYKHAAQFDLVVGQVGKHYPEATLVCNFDRPGELMSYDDVGTFFHEFGHLVHAVFAGQQPWAGIAGTRVEWDFVETPSMLLQQWASNPQVLTEFAKHHQTNEPIPAELVAKLRASTEFGKGLWSRRQLFLSAVSLDYYSRAPGFDTTQALAAIQKKLSPFKHEHREGTHFELTFGHLESYSAAYYTYLWSSVIAKDLESEFEKHGYLDRETAMKYRRTVLEPGGSKPASELVKDFLGREYGFDAYKAFLDRN